MNVKKQWIHYTRTSNPSELASVGRVGDLRLDYVRQGDHTILARSRSTSPWHLFPPIALDDTGCAYTLLVNPSGGLVGGDHLSIHATLGPKTHVILSTPSANRVYRSTSEVALQNVDLAVGPGAILEWIPELTIPFAGSRFRQDIHAALAPGATLVLWDALASGRIARGERWALAHFENEIRIACASGASVLERYHLAPGAFDSGIGLVRDWDYVASLYVIGDQVDGEVWKRLEERVAVILDESPRRVLGGVSGPAAPGLVVKLVARSAPDLNAALEQLWGAVRGCLWNLSAPAVRRY